ncbi:MAG: hypothetical protein AAF216_04965 [Pseudomonadota bacterium]
MSEDSNSIFTYGLGLVMGLPVASAASAAVTSEPNWIVILAFTLVLGALGAAGGYAIDRWREKRSSSNG